jgi:hypothetical protein
MESVLRGLNWTLCLVYIDDIVVEGPTVSEVVRRLGLVFDRLRGVNLKLKPAKCNLFQKSVTFLGHVVSEQGINTDPEKVKALRERLEPRCLENVGSFLGLVGYYRSHVPQYADIAVLCPCLT